MYQTNYKKKWVNQTLNKSLKTTLSTLVIASAASSAFAATTLNNGVSIANIAGSSGSETFYTLAVPAGSTDLSFNMSGGSGDADIYVKFGSQASSTNWDCRPYRSGNNETCNISTVQSGTYSVMLDAYSAYNGVSLVANFTDPGSPPPPPPVSGVQNTAAAGDSITMAFAADCTANARWWNLFCLLGGDQPEHSWFDGWSNNVNSVHDRYKALDSSIGASKAAAESGSEMRGTSGGTKPNFSAQASDIVAQSPLPDHVEVLLGGNDICNRDCTDPANCDNPLFTEAQWRESVRAGLDTLMTGLPSGSTVQLNGMPRVQDLRQAGLDKQATSSSIDCDSIWSSYDICRIVTNGGSQFGESSAVRLAAVAQAQQSYNAILAVEASAYNSNANGKNPNGIEVVSQYVNENTPSGGTFQFGASNIDGGDCFHPNVNTQSQIANFAWGANNDMP
jgi:lysophospholipase L1-like esterase